MSISSTKPIKLHVSGSKREWNAAQARIDILKAISDELEHNTLEKISIRPLTKQLGMAYATFFNHFPVKTDVLIYFIELWVTKVYFHALVKHPEWSGFLSIREIFRLLIEDMKCQPRLMHEIIAYIALARERPSIHIANTFDLCLYYPDEPALWQTPISSLGELFLTALSKTSLLHGQSQVIQKALDESAKQALFPISTLFYGFPIAQKTLGIDQVLPYVEDQLKQIIPDVE